MKDEILYGKVLTRGPWTAMLALIIDQCRDWTKLLTFFECEKKISELVHFLASKWHYTIKGRTKEHQEKANL